METEKNIQKISLIFFIALGLLHIVAHLMLLNYYMPNIAFAIRKIVEIPFIIVAAVYGLISLKISLSTSEKGHTLSNIIVIGVVIVIFLLLVYLNVFIPDRIS